MILFRDGIAMQRTMAERRWTWQVSISRWPRCVSRKFCSPSRLNYACSRFLDSVIRIPTGIHSSLVIWKFDEFRIDVFRRMDEKKFVTDGEFFGRNQRKIVIHVKLLELSYLLGSWTRFEFSIIFVCFKCNGTYSSLARWRLISNLKTSLKSIFFQNKNCHR